MTAPTHALTPLHDPDATSRRPFYGVKIERRPPLRLSPHPQAQTEDTWVEWARSQRRPLAVDLFAGGGGLSYGLQQAGYRVGLAVDTDRWAVETHAHNFGGLSLDWDLSEPERLKALVALLQQVDVGIVAGGPPCQPFSRAGRSKIRSLVAAGTRNPVDSRKDLWRVFLDVVLAVRPRAVLMENVPDMALGDEVRVVRQIVSELEQNGYDCNVDIRRAWEHGVPQHRQRLIVVATRDARQSFRWPNKRAAVSVESAIGDLPTLLDTTGASRLPYAEPTTPFQRRARRDVPSEDQGFVHDHVTRPVRADDRVAFELMDSSTKYSDLPAELRRYRDDSFDDKYKRLDGSGLSRTITAHIAKDGYWYIHPTEPRTISVREAARIQTFPDSYRFAGPRSAAFKQIGNAVPPALAESIGRRLLASFKTSSGPRLDRRVVESARVARAHVALARWAETTRVVEPWRMPGDTWHALVNAVTCRARERGLPERILQALPSPETATEEACAALASTFRSRTSQRAVERLPALASHLLDTSIELEPGAVSADELQRLEVFHVDSEADRLVVTPGTTRVATRVLGEEDDRNRLTTGRLAVARLVGHGEGSQDRMAALIALSEDVCFASSSLCGDCPLAAVCARSPMGPGVSVGGG